MTEGKISVQKEIGGKLLTLETGELAKQADGAVLVTYGEVKILVTATCSKNPREGIDFFPLTVDFEERLYAAGKIPGSFFRREGRPTERMILACRLIDRPIRPLFPKGFRNDVQVIALVFSSDMKNDGDIPAMIGASAALSISDIPFEGPIGGVRIGKDRETGELLVNPTFEQLDASKLDLVLAGTRDAIMMVEAGSDEVTEDEMLEAFAKGHEEVKKVIELIDEFVAKAGRPKRAFNVYKPDRDLEALVREHFTADIAKGMRITEKLEREAAFAAIDRASMMNVLKETTGSQRDAMLAMLLDPKNKDFDNILKTIEEEELRKMIVDEGLRPDGRTLTQIRPLSSSVGLIPRVHGSGLFTRGQTQVLNILTLGMPSEEQRLDSVTPEVKKRYIHHYNFPPFSVGETRPMRGPGRREIGHGALAERALLPVIPSPEEFPYTLRLVSEVLESNGSSSMASTCASCLSLMDGGVPIKAPVGGIAMGLVGKDGKFAILTDIQGMEDFLGEMDFKVAGTYDGITAIQMDIKAKGITLEIMGKALAQAKEARVQVLDVMLDTIPEPRPELSPCAPRIVVVVIHPDKIRNVIGPGGKIINKITSETGVSMDIEDDGRVFIASADAEAVQRAKQMVEDLTREVEAGEVYLGRVTRLMTFGAFVEILPGKEGLVHISQLAPERVERVEDVVKVGDEIMVRVSEIDDQNRINLTRKGLVKTDKPWQEDDRRPSGGGGRPRRDFHRSGGRR